MDRPWSNNATGEVILRVLVKPKASRTRVVGAEGAELVVQVAAPPVDGAANEELIRFLARQLSVSRGRVRLLKGDTSRHKVLLVEGVQISDLETQWGAPKPL